ncbi:uncharacterized protein [Dendrobates tinctorius]|uniref:uncharacterized protein isoform X3 n=1 Tax=Dendrobates tinctorius TaxID=92724 RepID=UPI003CCA3A5D
MWCAALQVEVPTISDSLSGDLLRKRIFVRESRMDRDRDKMVERVLHLTLEILFRITGEDYTVVKKTSSERCQAPVSEGWGRPLSPITWPPPNPLIHEDINDQKILELAYKMIELLTGEVPIRCQDVAVYLTMEEWEYLEGHKDLYKDVKMEVPQPLTSPVVSSKRTTPERCPPHIFPQDCSEENPNVPQDHQGEDLAHINTTDINVSGDEWCKEEIPTDNDLDDSIRSSEGHVMSPEFKANDHGVTQGAYEDEEHSIIPDIPSELYSKDLSSDPFQQFLSSDSLQTVLQYRINSRGVLEHQRTHTEKTFSCMDFFIDGSDSVKQETSDTEVEEFSSSEFVTHQISHTGENIYSCSKCRKCFSEKSRLVKHERIHRGDRPFPCTECGKRCKQKSDLITHQRIHTGEKPFLCTECGKCFNQKTHLVRHQKIHTGEKPYSCSLCGTCFVQKSHLDRHEKSHTGEKPYSCSQCGTRFIQKSHLIRHERSHTGEKPYSCSQCGKCFNQKSGLIRHQASNPVDHEKTHTESKPFLCPECGKCFVHKKNLLKHQQMHKGK